MKKESPPAQTTGGNLLANRVLAALAGIAVGLGVLSVQVDLAIYCIPLFGIAGLAWRAAHD